MANAEDDPATVAARELARARWGTRGLDRAAEVILARSAELPAELRKQVHEATAPAGEADPP